MSVEDQLKEAQKKIQEQQHLIGVLRRDLDTQVAQNEILTEEIDVLRSRPMVPLEELREVEQQNEKLQNEYDALSDQHKILTEKHKETLEKQNHAMDQVVHMMGGLHGEVRSLKEVRDKEPMTRLEKELSEAQKQLAEHEASKRKLTALLEIRCNEVIDLQKELDEQSSLMQSQAKELQAFRDGFNTPRGGDFSKELQTRDMEALRKANDIAESQLASMKTEMEQLACEYANIRTVLTAKVTEEQKHEDLIKSLTKDKDELIARLDNMSKQHAAEISRISSETEIERSSWQKKLETVKSEPVTPAPPVNAELYESKLETAANEIKQRDLEIARLKGKVITLHDELIREKQKTQMNGLERSLLQDPTSISVKANMDPSTQNLIETMCSMIAAKGDDSASLVEAWKLHLESKLESIQQQMTREFNEKLDQIAAEKLKLQEELNMLKSSSSSRRDSGVVHRDPLDMGVQPVSPPRVVPPPNVPPPRVVPPPPPQVPNPPPVAPPSTRPKTPPPPSQPQPPAFWICKQCTLHNPMSARNCEVCLIPKS